MILAEKIILLRKKYGWSQEELAKKMNVSRQAISKWEGALAVPDIEKILLLGNLFGVTTDYLLKDEIENEELVQESHLTVNKITLAKAKEFLRWRQSAGLKIAFGTFLCIISPFALLVSAAASETERFNISENAAVAIGLIILIAIVAIAVVIFVVCGLKNSPYEFIDKEPFETEYGVTEMIKETQRAYRATYIKGNAFAICILILSPISLIIGAFTEKEFLTVIMLCTTMLLAAIGVSVLITVGVRWASMQKLLNEGEYSQAGKRKSKINEIVSTVYWLTAVTIYLSWSFSTAAWEKTWIVWPVAAVIFAIVNNLLELYIQKTRPLNKTDKATS